MRRHTLPLLLTLAACGPSYTGTVRGKAFAPKEAIFATSSATVGRNAIEVMQVVLSTATGLCADANTNARVRGSSSLALQLGHAQPSTQGAALDSGIYAAGTTRQAQSALSIEGGVARVAFGAFEILDTDCAQALTSTENRMILRGEVVLGSFTPQAAGKASLTYDLEIGAQADKLTGNLTATYCPSLEPYIEATLIGMGATIPAPTLPDITCR